MKKLTKMNKFEMVMEILVNGEFDNKDLLIEFVQHEMDLLAKKNSTGTVRKPSKTQLENEKYVAMIEEILLDKTSRTISDIQAENEIFAEMTNQKMSALLKKLVDSQKVVKFVEKKKTYFQINNEQ
jgi:hypothetical protein